MTLRTKSRGMQALVWLGAACLCVSLYALAVRFFGTGPATAWYAPEQMRFFLPCLLVFGWISYETRWDGIVRKVCKAGPPVAADAVPNGPSVPAVPEPGPHPPASAKPEGPKPECAKPESPKWKSPKPEGPKPKAVAAKSESSGSDAWRRAREIPHGPIPDFEQDAEYLDLVLQAADEGCVPALEALAGHAMKRGTIVEAYFWAALAEKRGHAGSRQMLRDLRKEWMLAGCPSQHGNVHKGFSKERGSVARTLLRMTCGINVPVARMRLRDLARQGQADACLVLGLPRPMERDDGGVGDSTAES